jgi:anhydro-N-acetylmuramic acid kinase
MILKKIRAGIMAGLNTNQKKTSIVVAGLMSGSSLDGVDVVFCSFNKSNGKWHYKILKAYTFPYDEFWIGRLSTAHLLKGSDLIKLDRDYGEFLGNLVKKYISTTGIQIQLISSHGHTVFHRPDKGYTLQIGNGSNIAAITGIPTVYDFRSIDIAKNGQGAPLVPFGDKEIFFEYDSCLNLGGFSNISTDVKGKRIAFDICPVNIVLNELAKIFGQEFDKNGTIGIHGSCDDQLLEKLNGIEYYKRTIPKSLSREWYESDFLSILTKHSAKAEDKMATVYSHIVTQISNVVSSLKIKTMMVTGGGTFNSYLMRLLQKKLNIRITIPDNTTIKYKEALIFAFLGFLRLNRQINCLSSVTGADSDSVCGVLCEP